MTITRAKPGPKREYVTHPITGDPVTGLLRKRRWVRDDVVDGETKPVYEFTDVYRIVGFGMDGKEFTEHDPMNAVKRFFEFTAKPDPMLSRAESLPDPRDVPPVDGPIGKIVLKPGQMEAMLAAGDVPLQGIWGWIREQILTRPKYVARMTGIEEIGYLDKVEEPAGGMKLESLIDLYTAKPKLSSGEVSRSKLFWGEFIRWSGADTLGDITHETVEKYEAKALGGKLAGKSIKHRFSKVRCIIAYALKRGQDRAGCRKALDVLTMLEMPETAPLAPHPISPADFWKFYKAALSRDDQEYAAMLLTMLNLAMYPGEVSALRWDEVNMKTGEVVTRRPKTGVIRVGILWPETIAALKALPRDRDEIFCSARRTFTAELAWHWWKRYRDEVKLPGVKPSDIRDASYTIACQTTTLDKAKVLAGHKFSGMSDAYIARNPGFVRESCEAIGKAFDVAGQVEQCSAHSPVASLNFRLPRKFKL